MRRIFSIYQTCLTITIIFSIHWDTYSQNDKVYYYDKINYRQILEYFELYLAGQRGVVAAKMTNNDYSLIKYTPDYSVGKRDYIGDYTFEKKVRFDSRVPDGIENYWSFKSIKYLDILTEYSIEFNIHSSDSYMTFNSLSHEMVNNKHYDEFKTHCYPDTCVRVGRMYTAYCLTDPDYSPELELNPFSYYKWTSSITILPHNKAVTVKYPAGENEDYYIFDLTLGKYINNYNNSRRLHGTLYVRKLHHIIPDFEEFKKSYDNKSVEQKIELRRVGKIHLIPVEIGGKTFEYIIDSGASDMVINPSIELHLKSIGVIRDSDYLDSQTYTLADGSQRKYKRVKLASAKIGTTNVQNIIVVISTDNDAPLLLGKSFLDKFSYWKINNQTGHLEYKIK